MNRNNREERDLPGLEKRIGYKFADKSILKKALTHKSYANEIKQKEQIVVEDNQRLEFFGDAILGMIVTEFLYEKYPSYQEGDLTILKSGLVSKELLAKKGSDLELGNYIYLGRGEIAQGGSQNPTIIADCLEALIAAVYIDGKLQNCQKFIFSVVKDELKNALEDLRNMDYKGLLQHKSQMSSKDIPSYRVESEFGPEHDKSFNIVVEIDGKDLGEGTGRSKKDAEQEAAKDALRRLEEI